MKMVVVCYNVYGVDDVVRDDGGGVMVEFWVEVEQLGSGRSDGGCDGGGLVGR